jgi:polyhydroxyalkanoate synthesis regulator phasin
MADAIHMNLPLFREMRAESAASDEQTRALIKALEKRIGAVEETLKSVRHGQTADTLLSKLVTGEFEERVEILERRVRELESQK